MKRLVRSTNDSKLGGVIAGLADYFSIDANLLRLITVVVCFMTGIIPILITYFIAWVIIPEENIALNMPTSDPER
ncbi:MAG: PspC domain-containing protein [Calditrichota bacterium]